MEGQEERLGEMARQAQSWKLMMFSAAMFWLGTIIYVGWLLTGSRSAPILIGAFLFPVAAALTTLAAILIRRVDQRMRLENAYADALRARSYTTLEFPGTYHLAFRDLQAIFDEHVSGKRGLDFGSGTGRSTRFLEDHGFDAIGIDISNEMVTEACEADPDGDYRVIPDGDLSSLSGSTFDLVLSAFTFDNIATAPKKLLLFNQLRDLLNDDGRIINLVSSPEIYVNEWASFSTKDYPENKKARTGDTVRIVMLDVPDQRPIEDVVWEHEDYLKLYDEAGLEVVATERPLATGEEPVEWVNETEIAPWVIYVLARKGDAHS